MNRLEKPIEKPMYECLLEAFKDKALITSDGLAEDEFIYSYGGKAYYEDGACLGSFSETRELLSSQQWTRTHDWYVIGHLTEEDILKIKEMKRIINYDSVKFKNELIKLLKFNKPYQSDFNKGASYCRDKIIEKIVEMQNKLDTDKNKDVNNVLNGLLSYIKNTYGDVHTCFKE